LPASLEVVRLQNSCHIALEGVGSWRHAYRASAAVRPVLAVRAANVECSCSWSAPDVMDNMQLVSNLPDGFAALIMETQHITLRPPFAVHEATLSGAAWNLCRFFGLAPPSYRRFSVCWTCDWPLRIHVTGRRDAHDPLGAQYCYLEPVAFDTVDALAVHMRACAMRQNMSVAITVVEEPMKGIDVVRL